MTDCSLESSIPDWIIDHPETIPIFKEMGIDSSCGGKSLEYLCLLQDLDKQFVFSKLVDAIKSTC
ncbi:hypothetical protein [Rubinisphaera italica]|uniref:DUF1858 domain-containing protein n=1 Tax=Rubinisphaera italica TaxID=2527969 RepID=A0A5C5XF53_9PLAN|nr:hypothetical protein [Rubinisphaera italica]TWT61424.1 hypothetical protein Pan54_21600 [Rubinisphaera italica]